MEKLSHVNPGMAGLLVLLLCAAPVLADTQPVSDNPGHNVGSVSLSIIPDRAVYEAGQMITYTFLITLSLADPSCPYGIDHIMGLVVTLDPAIDQITSNAQDSLTGGGDGVSGNTASFWDPYVSMMWGFHGAPGEEYLGNSQRGGDILQVTGRIKPDTPPGTNITTTGRFGAALEGLDTRDVEITGGSSTVTVIPAPEFPSAAVPASMVAGLLAVILVIRAGKQS